MNKKISVLDSSAILAVLNSENGAEKVAPLLPDSIVGCINVAEVLTKLVEKNISPEEALEDFLKLGVEIIEFDIEQAAKVAELRPLTKHLGLSLGDRSCLALAILKNAAAVTADKNWANLNFCKIELIR